MRRPLVEARASASAVASIFLTSCIIDIGLERSIIILGADTNAKGVGCLQRIDNMEIVRKSFGEIPPRVHTRFPIPLRGADFAPRRCYLTIFAGHRRPYPQQCLR